MCQDHNGNTQSGCPDLTHARDGMKTFLTLLNPDADWVGLAVLTPASWKVAIFVDERATDEQWTVAVGGDRRLVHVLRLPARTPAHARPF